MSAIISLDLSANFKSEKMKKNKTFILLAVLLLGSFKTTFAQTWCPAGAKWTYSYTNGGEYGYVELLYTGDTVINSINCKKLKKTQYAKGYISSTVGVYNLGSEITYEQNGVVYIRTSNNFDTLYNFNALIGDRWDMIRVSPNCDVSSNITVLDTGTIMINSIPLKFLAVNLHIASNLMSVSDYQDTIVETIGFTGSYFFPADYCNAPLDGHEGGSFRCYSDNNFNTYKPHYPGACDSITEISEIKKEALINTYPNPALDYITINIDKMFGEVNRLELYNSFGQLVLLPTQLLNIDIKELPKGLYFIKVANSRGIIAITKFLKTQK